MTKEKIRQVYLCQREQMTLSRKKKASFDACTYLISLFQTSETICSFASKKAEIDLWPLNKHLAMQDRLALPRVNGKDLDFYRVSNFDTQLTTSKQFHVLEPIPTLCEKISISSVKTILVPGICFDKNHHRIGHGFGFYDRLIQKNPNAFFLGIGFTEQLVTDLLPIEKYDYPLNQILLF